MDKKIISSLRSPKTKGQLQLKEEFVEDENIVSGILYDSSGNEFEIIDSIPKFVTQTSGNTIDSFSYKWKTFVNASLQQQERNKIIFLEHYGFTLDKFKEFLSNQKKILDAGCGTGYISNWIHSETNNSQVFGIDISTSVEEASKYFCSKSKKGLNYLQADISELPFEDNFFDMIVCKEVIHHTPKPRENFSKLVKLLAPGGSIMIYVYKKKGPIREFCDDYLRSHTTKLDVDECHKFAEAMTELGRSLRQAKININIPKDIPYLNIKAGEYDLQRFIYWNIFKCWWDDEGDKKYSDAINFDWYHPEFAFRYTENEIKEWFKEEGLRIDNFNVLEAGITARGTKIK